MWDATQSCPFKRQDSIQPFIAEEGHAIPSKFIRRDATPTQPHFSRRIFFSVEGEGEGEGGEMTNKNNSERKK